MKNKNFLAFTFGPIGDTIMMLAFFDDILTIDPSAKFVIISRKNIGLIRELTCKYPSVEVRQIPSGLQSLPFFASLLSKRWIFLALGVAGAYSLRIKLFFLALSILPGNKTLGFDDNPGKKGNWMPLDRVLTFSESVFMIENFRSLLEGVYPEEKLEQIRNRAPHMLLDIQKPANFDLPKGSYVATNYFSTSSLRSWPVSRWKVLTAKLIAAFPDYKFVLLGGPADAQPIDEIVKAAPEAIPLASLPLREAGWVIEHAAAYIGVDTGITHLASVMQQKSLTVSHFRYPTWQPTYNPYGRAIANSRRCECGDHGKCEIEIGGVRYGRCMNDVSDDIVIESMRLALSRPDKFVPGFAGFIDENGR